MVFKEHLGIILGKQEKDFDTSSSTYGCVFIDEEDPNTTYYYYSKAKDKKWSHVSIELAISNDFKQFRKLTELNPLIDGKKGKFNSRESATPAVVRLRNHYYMFFSGSSSVPVGSFHYGRKIGVAIADDPRGPWEVIGVIAKPEKYWEGLSIDLGPSVVKINDSEVLLYYSNINNKIPLHLLFDHRYWHRSIGLLKVTIESPRSIKGLKHEGNPLKHLNGPKGSPHESIFCPGCFKLDNKYYLLPTMSTYSVGFPFHQYIGLVTDANPYFENAGRISVLINGPDEKRKIIPNIKSEIALDTPSPIVIEDKIYLYYSVMDRQDGIWKTALSIIDMQSFKNFC
ncbi:MAG: hypothetical protein NWF08_06550 [Candidatus Bathyarchaeota archaeon]|nr:hypothetical protein [Candidatus Bathyarchaeota archaeon]